METPFLEAGEDAGRSEQLAALLDEFAAGLTGETATSPFASDVPAGEIAPAALRTEEATAGEERLQDQAGLVGGDEHFVAPGADVGEVSEAEGEGDIPGEADTEADAAETEESAQATTSYEELEDLMTAHDEPAALVDPSGEAQLVATLERPSDAFEVDEEAPPFERQVPPAARIATRLTVSVRTDFAVHRGGRLAFDWVPGEPVSHTQVAIVGTALAAITNARGVAIIDTSTVPDGDHILRLSHTNPAASTTSRAGPAVADPLPARPARIYRVLDVRIRTRRGVIVTAWIAPGDTHGGIGNRAQATFSRGHLPIDWKPVWMQSPMKPTEAMRAANVIDMIVVHRTGGPRIGPAINTFLTPAAVQNAHYLIDTDGHVVKTAEDLRRANQAGTSRWRGRTMLNRCSIGIENVNGGGPFTAAQYASLLDLLNQLRTAYPTIPAHRIVGHSDIATTAGRPELLSTRRLEDPGIEFEWPTLEGAGLGMVPAPAAPPGIAYAGIFSGALGTARIALRRGDRDPAPKRTAVIGGIRRPGFAGTPINELQEDLEHIGYSLRRGGGPLGTFDVATERAIDRFQRHFFAGRRRGLRAGRLGLVDALTADWIKRVRATIP